MRRAPFIKRLKKFIFFSLMHWDVGLLIWEVAFNYFAVELTKGSNAFVMDLFV